MNKFFNSYATPLTAGLFFISLVSGVAIFVHVGDAYFHSMHEWLSMVLILPFVLHMWKNWRPFVSYFKRPPMAIALALSLVAAIAFVVPSLSGTSAAGGPPQMALFRTLLGSSAAKLAPALGTTGEELVTRLKAAGYTVESADETLNDVATKSGKESFDLLGVLSQPARATAP